MSVPVETLWEIKPHTLAKHAILRRYLGAWFGIMAAYNDSLIYLDGFAGPGSYKGGEDGSPIIALKIAKDHKSLRSVKCVNFVFVEEKPDRCTNLENEIAKLSLPSNFNVRVINSQFENCITQLLNTQNQNGITLAPIFAFIDPFGFEGLSFMTVKRLLSNPKSEVFVNIMLDCINRFVDHPNPTVKQEIIDLFGTTEVLDVMKSSKNRVLGLRELYYKQLNACTAFVRFFELRDSNNRIMYYLFFASNSQLGHVKMKEAFWNVDKSLGFYFSDATDADQMVLFEEDFTQQVMDILDTAFKPGVYKMEVLRKFIEDKSPFLVKHLKETLKKLESEDRIYVSPIKSDGSNRAKNTFADTVFVELKLMPAQN